MRLQFITLLFLSIQFSTAQSLKGVVTDAETKQSIPYASILLKSIENEFLEGVTTDDNGNYTLDYKNGNYMLQVNFLGFKEYTSKVTIAGNTTLNITMTSNETELDEITIVAETTRVRQLIDKKVIDIGKDLLASGGSAATVLSQLSEVNADEVGNISLRGSQNVNVLINGKPSPLSTAEVLRQIPADEIKQIEIITSPSAKYQANGITGIINIITTKKVRKGVRLNVNSNANSLLGYGAGTNFSYGKNKVNFRLGGSYNVNVFESENSEERVGTQPFTQESNFNFDGIVKRINTGIDWFPNEKNEFSTDINYTDNSHTLANENIINRGGNEFLQESKGIHSHKTFEVNTNYRHLFNKENHFLELDAQISNNKNNLSGFFIPRIDALDNATNNTVLIYNFAADYTKQINEKVSIETGYLWNNQVLDNELSIFDETNAIVNTETFENTQYVHAIYGLTKFKFSKWGFQAGLRAEFYNRDAIFNNNTVRIQNSFNNLFPSLHINYKYHENLNLTFGFNRRTSRPSLRQVNPIATQMNEFMIRQGNESLLPEFSNNFEITNTFKKDKFNLIATAFYRQKKNIIISNFTVNNEGVTSFSFINEGRSNAYGTEITVSYKPIKWLNSDLGINYNFEKLEQQTNEFGNDYMESFFITLRNQIKVSKKLKFDVSWNFNGPETGFFRTFKSRQRVNLGMRYSILNNKGNINLRVNNVFDTYQFVGTNVGDGFTRIFTHNPIARVAYLSFSYRFNQNNIKKRNRKNRKYKKGVID